jgi:hypothetical protein
MPSCSSSWSGTAATEAPVDNEKEVSDVIADLLFCHASRLLEEARRDGGVEFVKRPERA